MAKILMTSLMGFLLLGSPLTFASETLICKYIKLPNDQSQSTPTLSVSNFSNQAIQIAGISLGEFQTGVLFPRVTVDGAPKVVVADKEASDAGHRYLAYLANMGDGTQWILADENLLKKGASGLVKLRRFGGDGGEDDIGFECTN